MLKKSYLVIGSVIFCLLFSFKAYAGESFGTLTSGGTPGFAFRYVNSFTIAPSTIDIEEEQGGYSHAYFGYDFSYNDLLTITNASNKYLYGIINIQITLTITPPSGFDTINGVISAQPIVTDTLKIYPVILGTASNQISYRITYVFDGYQSPTGDIAGPEMHFQNYQLHILSQSLTPGNQSLTGTGSATLVDKNMRAEDTPLDRGLAGIIAQAIDNSDGLAVMAGYLYDIKAQDLSYYNQLVTQIAALTQAQNTSNANLLLILNELDLDFQQVQTILDLFPSYRTQVLQYWQQLLEMNAAQSSAAAEMDQDYGNKETQSAQLIDGLGSLNLPQVNQNDFNILGNVDSNSKANFFGLIGLITNNSLITTILIIIVTGAIVGYALYGKK